MKIRFLFWGILGCISIAGPMAHAQDTAATPAPAANPGKDSVLIEKLKAASANLSTPVLEIIKMHDAGADATVIQAYVENSNIAYSPKSDEIIYLHDHGIPNEVITAMIQHGAKLRQQYALVAQANAANQVPPPEIAPGPQYASEPVSPTYVAPTYVYQSDAYYPGYDYGYYGWPWYGSFGFYAGRPWYGYGHHGYSGRPYGSYYSRSFGGGFRGHSPVSGGQVFRGGHVSSPWGAASFSGGSHSFGGATHSFAAGGRSFGGGHSFGGGGHSGGGHR